jgi:hypothetical protein
MLTFHEFPNPDFPQTTNEVQVNIGCKPFTSLNYTAQTQNPKQFSRNVETPVSLLNCLFTFYKPKFAVNSKTPGQFPKTYGMRTPPTLSVNMITPPLSARWQLRFAYP